MGSNNFLPKRVGVPFLGLLLVIFVDRVAYNLFGDITLAPLASIIVLAGMTFFLKARWILLWSPIFALVSFFLLTFLRHAGPPTELNLNQEISLPSPPSHGLVRALTVLLAGCLCSLLAKKSEEMQKVVKETVNVLSSLPLGVLISTKSGVISYANEKAGAILNLPTSAILRSSFFSLFTSKDARLIELYSSVSESAGLASEEVVLNNRRNTDFSYNVLLFPLQSESGKLIVTVFPESNSARAAKGLIA